MKKSAREVREAKVLSTDKRRKAQGDNLTGPLNHQP